MGKWSAGGMALSVCISPVGLFGSGLFFEMRIGYVISSLVSAFSTVCKIKVKVIGCGSRFFALRCPGGFLASTFLPRIPLFWEHHAQETTDLLLGVVIALHVLDRKRNILKKGDLTQIATTKKALRKWAFFNWEVKTKTKD